MIKLKDIGKKKLMLLYNNIIYNDIGNVSFLIKVEINRVNIKFYAKNLHNKKAQFNFSNPWITFPLNTEVDEKTFELKIEDGRYPSILPNKRRIKLSLIE